MNMKVWRKYILIVVVLLFVSGCSNDAEERVAELNSTVERLESDLTKSNSLNDELQNEVDKLKSEVKNLVDSEKKTKNQLLKYQEKMKPYEGLAEEEALAKEAELAAKREAEKAEKERIAAEKKAAEEKAAEEEKARKEAELARGYETGITYEQLARTPDDYVGEKIKFFGKVIQVMEGSDVTVIRFAANDDYDSILYCEIEKNLTQNNRILEDDYITLSGVSYGLYSYQSTMGGEITIPAMIVDIIDR